MEFPYITYMAPISCMLNVHVVGYGQRLHVWVNTCNKPGYVMVAISLLAMCQGVKF